MGGIVMRKIKKLNSKWQNGKRHRAKHQNISANIYLFSFSSALASSFAGASLYSYSFIHSFSPHSFRIFYAGLFVCLLACFTGSLDVSRYLLHYLHLPLTLLLNVSIVVYSFAHFFLHCTGLLLSATITI